MKPFWRDMFWMIVLWALITVCVGCGWSANWRWVNDVQHTKETTYE